MKALYQRYKKAIYWGLLVLMAVWCFWYARPVNFYDLMGGREPAYLTVAVFPQKDWPSITVGNLDLSAGEPEMDAVMERLEMLRFRRNPLEVVLRFLPQGNRSTEIDPELDYRIIFTAYDQEYHPILTLNFEINGWYRFAGQRSLPLYISQEQERGRELGAFLWEMSQKSDSNL